MVTADEITNPDDVALSISVSGELKQSSSTKQLIYDRAACFGAPEQQRARWLENREKYRELSG